jgi:hypothetical protein
MPFLSSFLSFSTFHGKRCHLGVSDFMAFHAAELLIGDEGGRSLAQIRQGNQKPRKPKNFFILTGEKQ